MIIKNLEYAGMIMHDLLCTGTPMCVWLVFTPTLKERSTILELKSKKNQIMIKKELLPRFPQNLDTQWSKVSMD